MRAHIFSRASSLRFAGRQHFKTSITSHCFRSSLASQRGRWDNGEYRQIARGHSLPLPDANAKLVESVCHDARHADDVPDGSKPARGEVALFPCQPAIALTSLTDSKRFDQRPAELGRRKMWSWATQELREACSSSPCTAPARSRRQAACPGLRAGNATPAS